MDQGWRTLAEKVVTDAEVFLKEETIGEVHIGTDSIQSKRWTQFVTVVAVVGSDAGRARNRAIYRRLVVPRIKSLRERLLREVWLSVELGLSLNESLGERAVTIHIDANQDVKHESSKYVQELVGLAAGTGFKHQIKPNAWCATTIADHTCRTYGKLPRGLVA